MAIRIAPILFNVDAQPPVIQAAYDQVDSIHLVFIDALHPAAPGDVIMLDVANLSGSAPPFRRRACISAWVAWITRDARSNPCSSSA